MAKLTSLLNERFVKKEKPKMSALAEQSSEGNLSSFAGIFGVAKIGDQEKEMISSLLKKYAHDEEEDRSKDIHHLLLITSEVKAINNQAAILHGERIKRAQDILKKYKEGAFSSWLLATYGNRQTPYNFLQYYEFYSQIPKILHPQMESMPRQAIYTLASRQGEFSQKEEIVRNYKGESKQELITIIRNTFPLDQKDGRRENVAEGSILALKRLVASLENRSATFSSQQKKQAAHLLSQLQSLIEECKTAE